MGKTLKILSRLTAKIADLIDHDIDCVVKARSDLANLLRFTNCKSIVLAVTHRSGGGIERHLIDKAEQLKNEGRLLVILRPSVNLECKIELDAFESIDLIDLKRINWKNLLEIFHGFTIERLEVHSLMGWPFLSIFNIMELAANIETYYYYYVHDYISICPQIHLVDQTSWYCGEQGPDLCRLCMLKKDNPRKKVHLPPFPTGKKIDILEWRSAYNEFLDNAKCVIAPSRDAAERIGRYYPSISVTVVPHHEKANPKSKISMVPYDGTKNIRVAIIGAIRGDKGANVLLSCAMDALKRKLPIDYVVIGTIGMREKFSKLSNIYVTGKYQEGDVYDVLLNNKCHVAFFPSVWPETYSYTLSIGLNAGFHCFVFDIGAPAERLRALGKGTILPISTIRDPIQINNKLIEHFDL